MTIEFSSRMADVGPYPKAATYAHGGNLVKLASNETPWAPHQAVMDAIASHLESLNRYPDPGSTALRKALSERYDLAPDRITLGNGSCDILLGAAQALLEPGAEIVYAWPSFSMYPHLAAMTGARAVTVSLTEDGKHDLDAMLREITAATRIVIVCNPNNPTSTALPLAQIAAFLDEVPPHVCAIVDEAYCEFNLLDDPDAS
ncbi:MAG: histidinol-phosphate aminotransferase, partial [Thermoleophilaceae bacterium]|nr:histidinol-phosphate aminotransferase [Thermoleophilaceae bacterium]